MLRHTFIIALLLSLLVATSAAAAPEGQLTWAVHVSPASWTVSPDNLTYEFVLCQGVKFHNGDPVTAEDVKY